MTNKLAAILLALTAGCATDGDGALHLTGRLADSSNVTHVIATNANTGEHIVVDLKDDGLPDGHFDIVVPAGDAWIVTFADANKRGDAMCLATLQTGGIDAFSTKDGGTLDFGTVRFEAGRGHGKMTWEALEAAFGYDRETLQAMSKNDDVMLRYSNPDIDGNGVIDALEGHSYRLDLSGSYRLTRDGRDLTIADLVNASSMGHGSVRYLGTAITTAIPRDMNMNVPSGTITFEKPFYGTAMGPLTPMVPANTTIGAPHIKFGELDGTHLLGVVAHPSREAPSGKYQFNFDNGHLLFSNVFVPSAAHLMAASDYSVPFVQIRATNPQCTIDCDISRVDISWMKLTQGGWQTTDAPIDARLDVVAKLGGKNTYLAESLTSGATSVQWKDMPVAGSGLLRSELARISTAELCYVAVTYQSELGVKLTSQVQNPGCF